MAKTQRSQYELRQLSNYWFDLSKLSLGSLVLKLFEPEVSVSGGSLMFATGGLITALVCAKTGIKFARKVKEI